MANTPEELAAWQLVSLGVAAMPVLGVGLGVISDKRRGPFIGAGLGAVPLVIFLAQIFVSVGAGVFQEITFYAVSFGIAVYVLTCGLIGSWAQRRFR